MKLWSKEHWDHEEASIDGDTFPFDFLQRAEALMSGVANLWDPMMQHPRSRSGPDARRVASILDGGHATQWVPGEGEPSRAIPGACTEDGTRTHDPRESHAEPAEISLVANRESCIFICIKFVYVCNNNFCFFLNIVNCFIFI